MLVDIPDWNTLTAEEIYEFFVRCKGDKKLKPAWMINMNPPMGTVANKVIREMNKRGLLNSGFGTKVADLKKDIEKQKELIRELDHHSQSTALKILGKLLTDAFKEQDKGEYNTVLTNLHVYHKS
jgi:RNA-binding protein YhbY